MAEKKLPTRRKRASKGKVIRVSNLVYDTLNNQRRGRSWDCLLRKLFGLPDRQGNLQVLIEGILETVTGKFMLKISEKSWEELEQDAYEIAITETAKMKKKKVTAPLRMREMP